MKALERQAGASHVDLDTEGQWARVFYLEPTRLDFKAIVDAARSAAFPAAGMELEVTGTVVEGRCEHCGKPRQFLRVPETGQELELLGTPFTPGDTVSIRAAVMDWDEGHPVLSVLGSVDR